MPPTLLAPAAGPVLPLTLAPMLAQAAEGPLEAADHAYEVKWDGMRVMVGVEDGRLSLLTRNRIEAATRFPELSRIGEQVRAPQAILDGEIVRLVNGKPNFGSLQLRIQAANPRDIRNMAEAEPAALILFDLLRAEDECLLNRPWEERRRRLEALVDPSPTLQISPVWPNGRVLWETVSSLGMEGVMAKRRSARYTPGKRTPAWLKIKACQTVDAVVGGWTEGTGSRSDTLGALILGLPVDGHFVYIGRVGTGFDMPGLEQAVTLLRAIETPDCPFLGRPDTDRRPHWVQPHLVCEVKHLGWSNDARLRFPVFLRWRPDRHSSSLATGQAGR
jgi:bifunctional non-homologous end joining protein LigD